VLVVRVLGEFAVEVDGKLVELPASWRTRSLVGWLALHPGRHPRGQVAARFWPDVLDSSARASLRNALWALRRALGPDCDNYLLADRERVGLAGPPHVWVDAVRFEELVDADEFEAALALRRGDLLSGMDDEWIEDARRRHLEVVTDVHRRAAARAEEAGSVREAISWTRRWVELDPLAEDATRELVRRLSAAGERSSAMAAYARLRERLRLDLGIAPSPATRAVVEDLSQDSERPEPAVSWSRERRPLPARVAARDRAPFVGRTKELERLRAALAAARTEGRMRLAILSGEPGIGKSRLAARFAVERHRAGSLVLHGRCEEEPLVPYRPFVEALGALPGEEPSRLELFEAVGLRLERLAEVAPFVLVLEDLHWADKASLLLLRHLVLAPVEGAGLLVATYRDTEVGPGHDLVQTLADLTRETPFQRIRLPGLERHEVEELVDTMSEGEVPAGFGRMLHAETGGNPFFVGELVRHVADSPTPDMSVPQGVKDVVDARIARLSAPAAGLLRLAAVIGRPAQLDLLAEGAGLAPEQSVDAIEEAQQAGMLMEVGDRIDFAHALIRETVYRGLTGSRRALLHRRAAETLEARRALGDDAPLAELAHHFCESADAATREHAIEYALVAAEEASAQLAHEQAVELYTRALRLVDAEDARRRDIAARRALAFQSLSHALVDLPRARDGDEIAS
jgi:DNA-binding SARP family transcriptional activator